MLIGKAKVSEKGWVVIPKDIRDAMGLRPGDEVRFVLWPPLGTKDEGRLSVFKISTADAVKATRGKYKRLRGDMLITQELIEERRAEVEKEERALREWRQKRRTSA